jgi:hypothetical protein
MWKSKEIEFFQRVVNLSCIFVLKIEALVFFAVEELRLNDVEAIRKF